MNNIKYLLGLVVILCLLSMNSFNYVRDTKMSTKSKDIIGSYMKSNDKKIFDDSIAMIEIPKISLKKYLYSIDSNKNNIDINLEIMKESDMPDVKKGNLIIGGHSGNSKVSYFNNLYKLEIGDIVNIYYEDYVYTYILVDTYIDDKDGRITINRNYNTEVLTLFTCKNNDKNNYLVLIFEQRIVDDN